MSSPEIRYEPETGVKAVVVGCGSSGANMAAKARTGSLRADSSEDAELRIDRDMVAAAQMEQSVMKSANPPFLAKLKDACGDAEAVFIVCGLGGVAGGVASAAVTRACRALSLPVVASVALPFEVEGPMRRSYARKSLETLDSLANITIPFENNIINQTMANVRITRALDIMNRIILSPLEELLQCVDSTFLSGLSGRNMRGIYAVSHSSGIEWEKKAGHSIVAEIGDQAKHLSELHLFLGMSGGHEDSPERLGEDVTNRLPGCRVTVWVKRQPERGQNRIGALGLR